MSAFDRVLQKARAQTKRIVLPEGSDQRIVDAAKHVHEEKIAHPVLLGNAEAIHNAATARGVSLDGITIVDPDNDKNRQQYAEKLTEIRAHRGMTLDKAMVALDKPVTYACMMVNCGAVDGCVAGAITPTGQVVSNAMRYVGLPDGEKLVSSCFVMLLQPSHPVQDVMVIGDCALVIDPDADELARIAVATGESARQLLNLEPEVAMLSFSTAGSARHASVSKVTQATDLTRKLRPQWRVVGEVQLDAAVIPDILARKSSEQATDSPCNVLIFPNLDAGNIGYKLIERFGGAQAIGPILQGLNKPVNDLSRGCSTSDIISIIAVTAAQVGT